MNLRLKQAVFTSLRRNWFICFILIVFFAAGLVFGALAVKNLNIDQIGELSTYLNSYLEKVGDTQLNGSSLKLSFTENLYTFAALYVLGLSVIGLPLIPVVVFTRGFIIGFTVGFLAREKAVKGIIFAFISVVPQNLLLIPAIFIAAVMAANISLLLIRKRFTGTGISLLRPAGFYTLLMLGLFAISGLAGLCETYITPVFIKMAAGYLL